MTKQKFKIKGKEVTIEMVPPTNESSQIKSVGFMSKKSQTREGNSGTMVIEFHRGGVYTYSPCKLLDANNLMKALSAGTYFHENIKSNKNLKVEKIS